MRARLIAAALAAGLALTAGEAWAQTTSATVTGVVRSRAGEPVAGAVVEAHAPDTGVTRRVESGAEGRYRIEALSPGRWVIRATVGGQPVGDPRSITLRLQQTAVLDFTTGSLLTETIAVSAEAPLVDRSRVGSELRVDSEQVEDLPLNGRLVTDLALLDSSILAAPAGNFYGERGSVFVVNGQSGRANSFLVDGVDNNDLTSNTNLNGFMSQQVIQEFTVMTHAFAPEFGRATGGVLNIVTQRGGNELAGGGFAQGALSGLNPPGDFVASLPNPDDEQDSSQRYAAGVHMGGPFKKDVATWFAAFEHQQADEVTPYTGVDRHGVEGGWMMAPTRDDNLFLRTDFNLTPSSFLMARLSFDDRHTEGLNVGADVTPEAGFVLDERDVQLAGALTTVVSPSVINEARLLLGTSSFDQQANSDRPGVERPSGTFGGNNLNLQNRDESRIQLVDNISWQRHDHSMKFGVDVLFSRTHVSTEFNPNGNFLYDTDAPFEPGDCGDIFIVPGQDPNIPIPCEGVVGVDDDGDGQIDEPGLLTTYPIVFSFINGKPSADLDDVRIALFAQDSWQLHSRFLLSYGLRYDLSTYTLPEDAVVDSTIENGGAGRDTNNIAPRLGFTWTPQRDGRFVVRGGAGLFYDKLVLGFPAVASITSGTEIGMIFPQGLGFEITEDVVEDLGIDVIKDVLVFPPELTLRFSTGTELNTPYTVQYNLGVERAIGVYGALSAGVTRTLGYNMVLLKDLNPVVDFDPLGLPVHRDPDVGSIASFVSEGRSWYTGLDVSWRWRHDDIWYAASYTWAKALDEGPDPLRGGISLAPFCFIQPSNPATTSPCTEISTSDSFSSERGRSDADRRHRFVLSGSSPLGFLGLRASGVIQWASGIPFNVTTGNDENFDGITTDRPRGVGRNTGERTDLGVINDLRRSEGLPEIDSLDEPDFIQLDLRFSKPLAFESGGTGELFLQVFNLLDRFNAGTLEGAVLSRNFGEPVNMAGPPRVLELGFKLAF